MIRISKEEAIAIRKNLRGVNIAITGRNHKSKSKKYYCEESPYVLKFLDRIRSKQSTEHYE